MVIHLADDVHPESLVRLGEGATTSDTVNSEEIENHQIHLTLQVWKLLQSFLALLKNEIGRFDIAGETQVEPIC